MSSAEQNWIVPWPSMPHRVLSADEVKARTIIVGDIHGCFEEFKDLLEVCKYDPVDTTLILVGDLVNKGPFSLEMVQYARSNNVLCTRGNHEDSALAHALGTNRWPRDDSYAYVDSFTP
jgi:predicted phosphodiesterase